MGIIQIHCNLHSNRDIGVDTVRGCFLHSALLQLCGLTSFLANHVDTL